MSRTSMYHWAHIEKYSANEKKNSIFSARFFIQRRNIINFIRKLQFFLCGYNVLTSISDLDLLKPLLYSNFVGVVEVPVCITPIILGIFIVQFNADLYYVEHGRRQTPQRIITFTNQFFPKNIADHAGFNKITIFHIDFRIIRRAQWFS